MEKRRSGGQAQMDGGMCSSFGFSLSPFISISRDQPRRIDGNWKELLIEIDE
jgi:hypothetical protein